MTLQLCLMTDLHFYGDFLSKKNKKENKKCKKENENEKSLPSLRINENICLETSQWKYCRVYVHAKGTK